VKKSKRVPTIQEMFGSMPEIDMEKFKKEHQEEIAWELEKEKRLSGIGSKDTKKRAVIRNNPKKDRRKN
jgi:hypothetical protein